LQAHVVWRFIGCGEIPIRWKPPRVKRGASWALAASDYRRLRFIYFEALTLSIKRRTIFRLSAALGGHMAMKDE